MAQPTLLVVIASTRPGRAGLPVARWFCERAIAHGGFDVRVADLAELNLPLLDEPDHPRLGRYRHQHTRDWSATVAAADAVVVVTPEYNHGMTAPLKNAFDYLYREWNDKPLGVVSYGGVSGGLRAVQQIKQVAAALKLVPVTEAVAIPFARNLLVDGRLQGDEALDGAATAMLDELARLGAALEPLREDRRRSAA
jgi:NAD(P)H-dependent FMN reductase